MTIQLEVEVKNLPSMHVAYVRNVGPYKGDAALFGRLFGTICAWAGPKGLLGPNAQLLSIYHDMPEDPDPQKHRLDIAIVVPETTAVEGQIAKQKLEGGSYAMGRVKIRPDQYGEAWESLMAWLSKSSYQPDNRPCFEIYLNDPKSDPQGMHHVELCAAVKAK